MLKRSHRARRVKVAVVLSVLLVSTGCAAANAAWRAGPMGMQAERTLREQLSYGRAGDAWAALGDKQIAPNDLLLRHMYRGVVGYYAGEFAAGARSLDRAWNLVDDRFTRSVSRGAASLLTSDATLAYMPGLTEQLFIPYYAALNYLAVNERDAVGVEARRMATLLGREGGPELPDALAGTLRYVNGVLFEAAGEREDARVAYRNAAALLAELPADTSLARGDSGDVVVLLEDGFVARPEPFSLGVYMNGDELVALTTGDEADRLLMARTIRDRRFDPGFDRTTVGWLTYEVNWATIGEPVRSLAPLEVRTNPATFSTFSGNVSAGVSADFEREAGARLVRAIARTAVRYAALRAAEQSFESAAKDDDDDNKKRRFGKILLGIGLGAASVGSAVIDQPDLRAWQLLPDRVTVARLRFVAGEHPVEVVHGNEVISLGPVTVRPGQVTVLAHRVWPGGRPQRVAQH